MTLLLVIDVGTTTLRAALVDDALDLVDLEVRSSEPSTPFPGLVEFDAAQLAATALDAARTVLARASGPVVAVGITNQRASTVVWDQQTGTPLAPALGWQDLRTVGECITAAAEHDLALAPNQSATKVAWLLDHVAGARDRQVAFGTVDTWLAWNLTDGAHHVTDHTNAAVTGLLAPDASAWSDAVAGILGIPTSVLPRLVSSSGVVGQATALPGVPPLAALVGDQHASLFGQGCGRPGATKITFGTGGMLDTCTGAAAPAMARRSPHGTFPIVTWSHHDRPMWGVEGIMLSAGTNVEWLRDDLGLIDSAAASHDVASSVHSSDGVVYVPALLGLGTPHWDYGARGTLVGITRGTTAAHIVRAVLEGVAHRGDDLVAAAEADIGTAIDVVRVDGGMSANPTFVQALADAIERPVEVSPVAEATTRGAAFLAGLAVGVWGDIDDAAALWAPSRIVEPTASGDAEARRNRWDDAVSRARNWYPELSALDF
ncbi:glycerol kinase GlpK [soil metagenome]